MIFFLGILVAPAYQLHVFRAEPFAARVTLILAEADRSVLRAMLWFLAVRTDDRKRKKNVQLAPAASDPPGINRHPAASHD
jgi:hypothetical protein